MSNKTESYQPDTNATLGADGHPDDASPVKITEQPTRSQQVSSLAPVPRISIHVFCENPETADAFQGAADDRRLAKAHLTVQMGGIETASVHFQDLSTPNLIVVETNEQGQKILEELAKLAAVCDPSTKVIVVGQTNDITIYRELIRQGVSEYMINPINSLQVIETVSSLYVDPDAQPIGRNIAFVGARGGVGSSSLAHNVGWIIAERLKEGATIVDLDLPFGTTGLDFNQDPAQGIGDAIMSPERVDDVLLDRLLVKQTERLSLFTSPSTLDREFDLDPIAFESVLDIVRKSVPYVIIDMPHLWTAWSKSVLLTADDIVIVASPDLASLRNAKNYFEILKSARPNDNPARLVINQSGVPKRPEIPTKDFAEAIGVKATAVLQFDPHTFGVASNNGQMLAEVDEKSAVVAELEAFTSELLGREPEKATDKSSIFSVFKKKRSA